MRKDQATRYGERRWDSHLKRKYGIDANEYQRLLEQQGGKCGICEADSVGGRAKRFHLDHDHKTGAVRGLLCSRCNQMIGYARDNPGILEAGAAYLRRIAAPVAKEFIRAYLEITERED